MQMVGFRIAVATSQSGIAAGLYRVADVDFFPKKAEPRSTRMTRNKIALIRVLGVFRGSEKNAISVRLPLSVEQASDASPGFISPNMTIRC
jgi:hypothetical protein